MFVKKNGRPLSFFIYAKQTQSGFERDTRGYRVSTLAAAHDEYLEISEAQPHRRKQIYNEYFVRAETPYFMIGVPKDFTAREIAEFQANSMAALAEISEYKPNIFKQIVDWVKRIILKLRGTRIKADAILADELERNIKMLEDYVKQVYNSRDTKKAAKNGGGVSYSFEAYNEHQIKNWKNSNKIVLYDGKSGLLDFVNKAISEKDYKAKMYFGTISEKLAEKIKEKTSLDLFGRNVTLRADNVRKILKPESHGDMARERKKKQVAVQKSDFAKIIDVMGSPDIIELSSKEYEGKPAVVFSKNIDEQKVTVIAVDSGGSLDLFIQTMYIGKIKGA